MSRIPSVSSGEQGLGEAGTDSPDCNQEAQRPDDTPGAAKSEVEPATRPEPDQSPSTGAEGAENSSSNRRSDSAVSTPSGIDAGSEDFVADIKAIARFVNKNIFYIVGVFCVVAPKVWPETFGKTTDSATAAPATTVDRYEPVSSAARWVTAAAIASVAGGLGFQILRYSPEPVELPELPPASKQTIEQRWLKKRHDDRKAAEEFSLIVGPLCGGVLCVLSHAIFLSFAGWTWAAFVGFVVLGAVAGLVGAALEQVQRQTTSDKRNATRLSVREEAASTGSEDVVAWSRKVQRGSLALKRWGHRKTLYGVAALWWVSRFFSNAIKAAQQGNRQAMGQIESYEDSWFTGGLIGRAQDTVRVASDGADRVLQLIGYWNTICDLVALAAISWSLIWMYADCIERKRLNGETGLFGRELLGMAGVNLVVWLLLLCFWPF